MTHPFIEFTSELKMRITTDQHHCNSVFGKCRTLVPMPIEYAAKAWKNNILDNFSTSTRPANLTGCISTGQTDKQVLCIICILRNCVNKDLGKPTKLKIRKIWGVRDYQNVLKIKKFPIIRGFSWEKFPNFPDF